MLSIRPFRGFAIKFAKRVQTLLICAGHRGCSPPLESKRPREIGTDLTKGRAGLATWLS
jgi:hypothetical protein